MNQMLYRAAIVIMFFLVIPVCAEEPASAGDLALAIKSAAQRFTDALRHQDFGTVVSNTYPSIVKKAGGQEVMLQILQKQTAEMKTGRTSLASIEIGDPTVVKTIKGVVYALVPQQVAIETPRGKLIQDSYLIAVSGVSNTWYFVDMAASDDGRLQRVLPDLVGNIVLPRRSPPTVIPHK